MSFRWQPGVPLDEVALERLKRHFLKPAEPPPQAWFMGDITYYYFIIKSDPTQFPIREIEWYLHDTSGGLRIFTEVAFAQERWRESFHYLLPYLTKRSHEASLLSDLIAYFFHIYPDSIPEIYPEYRTDLLMDKCRQILMI